MNHLYINNCRGFVRSYTPILDCNFLVGENSTGKSSFLSILRAASSLKFIFESGLHLGEDEVPAAFSDLVSAGSQDKSYFDIGIMFTEDDDGENARKFGFTLQRYHDYNGQPRTSEIVHWSDGERAHLRFTKKGVEYDLVSLEISSPAALFKAFRDAVADIDRELGGFTMLPKEFPTSLAPGFALSIVSQVEAARSGSDKSKGRSMIPYWLDEVTWVAPIRSRPKRIYHGAAKGYSSEGDHMPFLIKKQLKSRAFVGALRDFGRESGLFEVISTHTFGRGKNNPFEVLVKLGGASHNMENVGYGVSQVLPLIVEFLASKTGKVFAVQQPEVHLHPKAQAALGSLMHQLAAEKGHSFVIETHSDYLIDRFRLDKKKAASSVSSQVLFFSRSAKGNSVTSIEIGEDGRYPQKQPAAFRNFFINEESRMFSL